MKTGPLHVRCTPEPTEWLVVRDGKPLAGERTTGIREIALGPDGARLAYVLELDPGADALVLDGERIALQGDVLSSSAKFSASGRRFYLRAALCMPARRS